MYDRTHNLVSPPPLAKRSSHTNTHGRKRMFNEPVLEKMKPKIITKLHEEWAIKNGYRENDRLNSKNTISFKNGAER